MAKKKKPSPTPGSAADAVVIYDRAGGALSVAIPISHDFEYQTADCGCPGIEWETFDEEEELPEEERDPSEILGEAQAALQRRLYKELVSGDVLRAWLRAALAARGDSLPKLAADILGLPLDKATRANRRYKSELRALQRLAPGAKKEQHRNVSAARAGLYRAFMLREARASVSMLANWRISNSGWSCNRAGWVGPDMEREPSPSHSAIEGRRSILNVCVKSLNDSRPGRTPAYPTVVKAYRMAVAL